MNTELRIFEKKLTTLLEHTKALRMANEVLKKEVERLRDENQSLALRTESAVAHIEALMQQLPEAEANQ